MANNQTSKQLSKQSSNQFFVVVKNLAGQTETAYLDSSELAIVHALAKQYKYIVAEKISEEFLPKHRLAPTISKWVPSNKATEHPVIGVNLLSKETAVTCKISGHTFSIKLGTQWGINLECPSPLALEINCRRLLRVCQAHGQAYENRYSRNELAAMLLTLLRSKGLLACKDGALANFYLCEGTDIKVISKAIHYVLNLTSALGIPQLSLLNISIARQAADRIISDNRGKSHAQIQLENWLRDAQQAQAEFSRTTTSYGNRIKKEKGIKVYQTLGDKQAAYASQNQAQSGKLISELIKEQPLYKTYLLEIQFHLKNLAFLSAIRKQEISAKLIKTFPGNEKAKLISQLIDATKTDALENDLLDFQSGLSDSLDAWKKNQPKKKVDLMKYLKKNEG